MKPLLVALAMFSIPALSTGATGPQPPCGTVAAPAYSPPGMPPAIVTWHGDDLARSGWKPPDCSGWAPSSHSRFVLAIAGSFRFDGGADELAARVGAISALRDVRYWSVTDKLWRPLLNDASALSRPDPRSRRADFGSAEMTAGSELYYWENDSRSGKVVHQMTVLVRNPARLVIAIENRTPVRFLLVTLFDPGALQSVEFFDLVSPGVWGFYLLTRTGEGVSALAGGHEASYVNRAVAIFRHLAGLQTDEEPPASP